MDPSLFTGPYDAGLTRGLEASGVNCHWAVRPLRRAQRRDLPDSVSNPIFYRSVDDARWIPSRLRHIAKGLSHILGCIRLIGLSRRIGPDVIHIQWTVFPLVDLLAMLFLRRYAPVVLTVHDTVPFNGERLSFFQNMGLDLPMAIADRVIVHTRKGVETLVRRGVERSKIRRVPHGPIPVPRGSAPGTARRRPDDPRRTFVLFGQLKAYKGIDILIEAIGLLPPAVRAQMRVIVAGEPMMDMAPLRQRLAATGASMLVEFRLGRLSETEMARLFGEADIFLFPYRQIDASGVYYMVRQLGRWIIASRIGVFEEDFVAGVDGEQITPADPGELAGAMARAISEPLPEGFARAGVDWPTIGRMTRDIYFEASSSVSRNLVRATNQ